MLISLKSGISNVKNATVYVGGWHAGKKEGRGICYDASGNVVFKGKFLKDKPSETLMNGAEKQHFVLKDIKKGVYLGEMKGKAMDGFGLTLKENGEIVFGMIKNNVRQGVGMVFYSPDVWEVGVWTNGAFTAFKNSQTTAADMAAYKNARKEAKKVMRSSLFEAAGNFAQAGMSFATIANGVKGNSSVSGAEVSDGSVPSGKSQSYYQTLYNKYEAKAEKTFEDRVRHKASANISGDSGKGRMASSDAKLLKTYQKSMRKIRLQAKKEGFDIAKSAYEDVSF